jgi:hypothetical protein
MPMGASKIRLRRAAANALAEKEGFEIEERTGKGIRPGARFTAKAPKGPPIEVAVRTGRERSLSFSRTSNGNFRTLQSVQLVLGVVPDDESASDFEVLAFKATTLDRWYGNALKALEDAGRSPDIDVPIFIPLDEKSKKNVGHNIAGLKNAALWSVRIGVKQLEEQSRGEDFETFIDRVKREFAERNEVDVSKVSVEFRILA